MAEDAIWHGTRNCPVTLATIPKADQVVGQPCVYCGNTVGAYIGEAPAEPPATPRSREVDPSEQLWHGTTKCPVSGKKVPKANRVEGQRCPFCGNTMGIYIGPKPKSASKIALILVLVFVVLPVLAIVAALFLGSEISSKFSEVGATVVG